MARILIKQWVGEISQHSLFCLLITFSLPVHIREFKIWRRQRQQQRHKSMIWLVEWESNRAARAARFLVQPWLDWPVPSFNYGAMFWRSLPNDDVKLSYLRFWRQRELAAVNLSFFAITWKPFLPSRRKCSSPIFVQRDQHGIIAKHFT